jgi:hypothetical protein
MTQKYIYKVETIKTHSPSNSFQKAFEKVLNANSAEGWELHSFEITGEYLNDIGTVCTVVFQKDANEAILEK